MNEEALGVVEVEGMVPALLAADTMLKSANVTLTGFEKAGGGLISILIKGDLMSVKIAIDAGVARATGSGKVLAARVLARPDRNMGVLYEILQGPSPVIEKAVPTKKDEVKQK